MNVFQNHIFRTYTLEFGLLDSKASKCQIFEVWFSSLESSMRGTISFEFYNIRRLSVRASEF